MFLWIFFLHRYKLVALLWLTLPKFVLYIYISQSVTKCKTVNLTKCSQLPFKLGNPDYGVLYGQTEFDYHLYIAFMYIFK